MQKKAEITAVRQTSPVGKAVGTVLINLVLWVFSLSCIFPLVWMLYSSFKEKRVFNADIIGLPKVWDPVNYINILSN